MLFAVNTAKGTVKETRKRAREAEAENKHVIARADASRQRIGALETRNDSLVLGNINLTKRLARVPANTQRAIKKAVDKVVSERGVFNLKQGGVITDTTRDLVSNLVANWNVPVSSVEATINAVASAAGLEVNGKVSPRSIGRVMLEGDVAATVQLVDKMVKAKGTCVEANSHDL